MITFSDFDVMTFDCYNTLIDFDPCLRQTLQSILQAHEVHLSDEQGSWKPFGDVPGRSSEDPTGATARC